MARIRTIKPEFFTSQQIAECSTNARLLFVGMWCFCDDQGVHPASCKRLKMEVFPGDDFRTSDIELMVAELLAVGLIEEFESDGERFWFVTGWARHQKIDRPNRKYPCPFDDHSTNDRRMVDEQSPPEGKGKERKGIKDSSLRSESSARSRFSKPSLGEIREYFQEIGLHDPPEVFRDFYEAKGWMVGRAPMRDWRAAARNWKRRKEPQHAQVGPPASPNGYRKLTEAEREVIRR